VVVLICPEGSVMVTNGVVVVEDDVEGAVVLALCLGVVAPVCERVVPGARDDEVDDVGETTGVVVRRCDLETVVGETRGSVPAVEPVGAEVPLVGMLRSASSPLPPQALVGSMNRKTPTAVAPPIQTSSRLGRGFQLPPLVTEWRCRPISRA
jgi:hypothetical protein